MDNFSEHRFSARDGLSLYYRRYGYYRRNGERQPDRPAILCLPGTTRNSKDFHGIASHFCDLYALFCPDYRGRGQSAYDADPDNYTPQTYLDDIRHLLVLNSLHRVIIIGTSLGGLLAMGMAAMAPTSIAGVVLNDIGPDIDGLAEIIDYIRVDRPQPNWPAAAAELQLRFPDLSLHSEGDWTDAAKATWREGADGMLHFDWDVDLAQPLANQPIPDLWPLFGALRRLPVLAIHGERSKVLSSATFDKMAAVHPNLHKTVVKGVGHTPTLKEPVCIDALEKFLASID
ncbi:MAG: alpha/beta fold hydrolase [Alphaproteobacteria bacterium]|jgi:pimeloyl-ACP methyl ester carboxylesterase